MTEVKSEEVLEDLESQSLEILTDAVERSDISAIRDLFEELPLKEITRILSRLDESDRAKVLALLNEDEVAEILDHSPEILAGEFLLGLPPGIAALVLTRLHSDAKVDILAELPPERIETILLKFPQDEAESLRKLLQYPEDTAGGLMSTEFLSCYEHLTIKGVLEQFRKRGADLVQYPVQYIYVVNHHETLHGVLRLQELLFIDENSKVADIALKDVMALPATALLDEVEAEFDETDLMALPVVSKRGRILGIIRRADLEEALGERAEDSHLRSRGILGGDEIRTMPVGVRARRRLSWLSVNIGLNLLSASIIALYQDVLGAAISLAVFLPIISDMSGCSGNQAVAVSMRELSLGLVKSYEVMRVLGKEMIVGLINGVILGLLIACAAMLWKGNPYLGLIVGAALAVNTLFAVMLGGSVPLMLKYFKIDPAIASGPVLTTLTDMLGFFLILSMASYFLPFL